MDAVLKDFILTDDALLKVSSLLLQDFNNGLSKKNHDSATVKMFPTFVRDVPDGSGMLVYFVYNLSPIKGDFFCKKSALSRFSQCIPLYSVKKYSKLQIRKILRQI